MKDERNRYNENLTMDKITRFSDIPKFIHGGNYAVTVDWKYMEQWIESATRDVIQLELNPDFQRGHVWTQDKQIKYVEFILRGGQSSKIIHWSCAGWMDDFKGPMFLVDGKQRMEAVRAFLNDEFEVFGSKHSEFTDNLRVCSNAVFTFQVNNLKTRKEVLQWYLDLNSGGVLHTEEELNKVHELLKLENPQE